MPRPQQGARVLRVPLTEVVLMIDAPRPMCRSAARDSQKVADRLVSSVLCHSASEICSISSTQA